MKRCIILLPLIYSILIQTVFSNTASTSSSKASTTSSSSHSTTTSSSSSVDTSHTTETTHDVTDTGHVETRILRSYNSSWKCGECLYNGYKSCVYTPTDHYMVTSYNSSNSSFSQCSYVTDFSKYTYEGWTCTEAYNNTIYAKYACPYNTKLCGVNDTYTLSTELTI